MNKILVYCENCKYYARYLDAFRVERHCYCSNNISVESKPQYKHRVEKRSTDEINKNNDCAWYERKWWKFWVKSLCKDEIDKSEGI